MGNESLLICDQGELKKAHKTVGYGIFLYKKGSDLNKIEGITPYYAGSMQEVLNAMAENNSLAADDKTDVVIRKIEYLFVE